MEKPEKEVEVEGKSESTSAPEWAMCKAKKIKPDPLTLIQGINKLKTDFFKAFIKKE